MITVIFATHNGEKTLPIMLEAFCQLNFPFSDFKIIAADNASTDASRTILEQFSSRLPLQIVSCPQRGKNHALNAGLELLEGDLVVFTDDDIIPDPDWLNALLKGAEAHPEFHIFGGAIRPEWPTQPPDWILRNVPLGMTYGITDENQLEAEVDPGMIWGANMMCRAELFSAGHRFNVAVGPSTGNYVMGSETEFTRRMLGKGYRSFHLPTASVRHIIRVYQLERDWLLNRSLRAGRASFANHNVQHCAESPSLCNIPRWMVRNAVRDLAGAVYCRLGGRTEAAFAHLWALYRFSGYAGQAIRSMMSRRTAKNRQ